MNVQIQISAAGLVVRSPYNRAFVAKARDLGGRWDDSAWTFDVRDEDRVRELCRDVYGDDGSGPADTVTLRVEWTRTESENHGPITLAGRSLARAFGRDSGAKLEPGVVVIAGDGFDSSGSHRNWKTCAYEGTVALVRDFPRAKAEELIAAGSDYATFAIEPEAPVVDRDALAAERDRLLARVAEIDGILASE